MSLALIYKTQIISHKTKTRRLGESLIIGDNIKITVEEIGKGQIKLGIEAPKDVVLCREGVFREIKEERLNRQYLIFGEYTKILLKTK
jgi:carbon storage regulator